MRRSKLLIVVYARQAAAEGWRVADELGELSRGIGMSGSTIHQGSSVRLIARLAALWIVLLVLPFAERTLLGAKTYYFLYIGLGLVFVLYGLTIRSLFSFLYHTRRDPAYVWIAYLAWSVFICSILSVFAIEYDLLPHTPELYRRPLIDYLYYEIITFTTVGYGDVIPSTAQGKLLAICTALLGATHGVTFVALVLHGLAQHPPAKNQQ
jgi:voltage-gated potassium channel